MDCSHPIRDNVTGGRQSGQNVVLVLVGVEDVDLVSTKVSAQLPQDSERITLSLQDDVCPDARVVELLGEPSGIEENR